MGKIETVKASTGGIYLIGLAATTIGIGAVMILNMSTPMDYVLDQLADKGEAKFSHHWGVVVRRLGGLLFLSFLSCPFLFSLMSLLLRPISTCLKLMRSGNEPPLDLVENAKRRCINLPFLMIPVNVGLWILLPAGLFYAAYATGRVDSLAATTLAVRSTMVGLISAAIASFWIESLIRRRLIPVFFPGGRLADVKGAARISISRRIRIFYRVGSLIPLAILLVTLLTLQWQVDATSVSAKEYGQGIMFFSLILFGLFFLGSSALNRLMTRSIVEPVNHLLHGVARIRQGDYQTPVEVVGNDEIGILGDATNEMMESLAERERLRDAFGKYVSPEIRDEILSGRIPLDGELKEVTVLFADLRGFTPLVESSRPKEVVKIINGYFEQMSEAIHCHGGLVMQFIGDEIEAVFGAPLELPGHPSAAARAALEMRERLFHYNCRLQEQGLAPLKHGISLHTGQVVAANIGSQQRLSYAIVGDTVNVASRLQGVAKELGRDIILSSATRGFLRDEFQVEYLSRMTLKGKTEPIDVFAML